jgi:hypothetical protein
MSTIVWPAQSNRSGVVFGLDLGIFDVFRSDEVEISHAVEQFHQHIFLTRENLVDAIAVEKVVFVRRQMGEFFPH